MNFTRIIGNILIWAFCVSLEAQEAFVVSANQQNKSVPSLIDYVNPLIGTDNASTATAGMFGKGTEELGHTLPAVLEPNGMTFWTPQTQDTELKGHCPYLYKDERLQGFRASHWIVGGCTQDYGSVTIMPVSGRKFSEVESDTNEKSTRTDGKWTPKELASRFSHEDEVSTPAYYKAVLKDYGIVAEMTGRSHSAIFRFDYPKDSDAWIVVTPNSDEGMSKVEALPEKHVIRGYNPAHRIYQGKGEPCGFSGWFVIHLPENVEWEECVVDSVVKVKVKNTGKPLLVKVAMSFVDWDGCEKNLSAEIPHWDFDKTRRELEGIWEAQLSKVRIMPSAGGMANLSESMKDNLTVFYTAMYHASFLPHEFSDVDGRYPSFGGGTKIMRMPNGKKYYDDFSAWDTYRALHPLLNILAPSKASDMMQSLVLKYEQGGWMPIFPCWNSYTAAMIGDHCASLLADAYIKGIRGFDIEKAYEGMRKNAFESPATYEEYANGMGRRALPSYLKYGYIPLEDSVKEAYHQQEQVSRTLEYAYDDYALAQVAKRLGKKTDYKQLIQRSKNYRNVISPASGYAQGRHADGTFLTEANQTKFCKFITEGAPCHYTWYVPHDVKGLVSAMGGKRAFELRLDSLFSERRYWHGNEPCHQVPYLYNYIGQADKTQAAVRRIMATEYNASPGGLSGNDDAGQMSAWYIFSALGFYPVCPSTDEYAIGSPLFDEATISLENGRTFTIKAHGNSTENVKIKSMRLNGKSLARPFLKHSDIINGGALELWMEK